MPLEHTALLANTFGLHLFSIGKSSIHGRMVNYGDNSMHYEPVVWADRALTARPGSTPAALMWALDDELKQRNIEVPFPQRDLPMRSGTLHVHMDKA